MFLMITCCLLSEGLLIVRHFEWKKGDFKRNKFRGGRNQSKSKPEENGNDLTWPQKVYS